MTAKYECWSCVRLVTRLIAQTRLAWHSLLKFFGRHATQIVKSMVRCTLHPSSEAAPESPFRVRARVDSPSVLWIAWTAFGLMEPGCGCLILLRAVLLRASNVIGVSMLSS